jgi:hypothetical protein
LGRHVGALGGLRKADDDDDVYLGVHEEEEAA